MEKSIFSECHPSVKMVKELPMDTFPDKGQIDMWTKSAGQIPARERIEAIVKLKEALQIERSNNLSAYIRNEEQNRFLIEKLYEQRGEEPPNVERCYPKEFHTGIPGIEGYWKKLGNSRELYDSATGFYVGDLCEKSGIILYASEEKKCGVLPICVTEYGEE
jgi:hypothetical protein